MLRTVLLPTDLSDRCARVVAFAEGLPALGVHRVILAHVVEASGLEGPIIAAKVDEARDRLAKLAERLEQAGLLVELRVPAGDPFRELYGLAASRSIDAVVCGTHGKGLVQQMFQGSISERLLSEGPKPMLLARFGLLKQVEDPAELAGRFGERVVMPTDFSAPARRAFDLAVGLPSGSVGQLRLVHAVENILDPERLDRVVTGATFQLENLKEIAESQGIETTISVRKEPPADAVLAEIAAQGATGVIMGSRGRGALGQAILGSISMKVVREAPCPVLVVQ